jgi:hypothetical protein
LNATVPGWTRWWYAEEMLQAMRGRQVQASPQARADFGRFLKTTGSTTENLGDAEREKLFREFQRWQRRQQRSDR